MEKGVDGRFVNNLCNSLLRYKMAGLGLICQTSSTSRTSRLVSLVPLLWYPPKIARKTRVLTRSLKQAGLSCPLAIVIFPMVSYTGEALPTSPPLRLKLESLSLTPYLSGHPFMGTFSL